MITFLLLAISSCNFHDVCQRFLYIQEQKSPTFVTSDMTLQKLAIFIMGVYGENSCLLSDQDVEPIATRIDADN